MADKHVLTALVALAFVSTVFRAVNACSCLVPTPNGSFEGNISVHKVRVLSAFYGKDGKVSGPQNLEGNPFEFPADIRSYFLVSVLKTFKNCDARPNEFVVENKNLRNSCSNPLAVGKDYLLHLSTDTEFPGVQYCKGDQQYPISEEWSAFLDTNNECTKPPVPSCN